MESLNKVIKRVSDYVQSDIQPALKDKPMYQLLLKYGFIVTGAGLVLLADIKHLLSALLGFVLVGVGVNLFKGKTMDDTSLRKFDGTQVPLSTRRMMRQESLDDDI